MQVEPLPAHRGQCTQPLQQVVQRERQAGAPPLQGSSYRHAEHVSLGNKIVACSCHTSCAIKVTMQTPVRLWLQRPPSCSVLPCNLSAGGEKGCNADMQPALLTLSAQHFSIILVQVAGLFERIWEELEDDQSLVFVLIDEVESLTAARQAALAGGEPSDSIRCKPERSRHAQRCGVCCPELHTTKPPAAAPQSRGDCSASRWCVMQLAGMPASILGCILMTCTAHMGRHACFCMCVRPEWLQCFPPTRDVHWGRGSADLCMKCDEGC